ncbi:Cytokinin dehydrogenase 10 [Platanthera guangdongensis]|uniref:cytokinin dehydrogenase n=1 Tax=Platanthera guangdongensis TaxID=2320717 RepID=A0ABR2LGC3_9ASPA
MSIAGQLRPCQNNNDSLPSHLLGHSIATRLRFDRHSISSASSDFGHLVKYPPPAAVFRPSRPSDIAALLRLSHSSPQQQPPFTVAARGRGHSTRGQALAPGGVVVDMSSLGGGIAVSPEGMYVDAGGEKMWYEVLRETVRYGLTPRSWTDYLYLTVGGTLSNGGVSGQAFLHGPQITNVYELDVVTGMGELLTCSEGLNPELFFAVLGGLGQFGVITRARIALERAPKRVRWMRLMYTEFEKFRKDQEMLISNKHEAALEWRLSYVEGSLLMDHSLRSNWRSSFFSDGDLARLKHLAFLNQGRIYCLEASYYYYSHAPIGWKRFIFCSYQDVEELLEKLSFTAGFAFANDVSYMDFLNRVHEGEVKLRGLGLWDVPHPWLNLFVPKSNMTNFHAGVFKSIMMHNKFMGPILVYPTSRSKWDERMSAVVPDEDVFYSVGILLSSADDWESLEKQNIEILQLCDRLGMKIKQYLPHYRNQEDWMKHFGEKWERFAAMKRRYDPKAILSPGQRIFAQPIQLDPSDQEPVSYVNARL